MYNASNAMGTNVMRDAYCYKDESRDISIEANRSCAVKHEKQRTAMSDNKKTERNIINPGIPMERETAVLVS